MRRAMEKKTSKVTAISIQPVMDTRLGDVPKDSQKITTDHGDLDSKEVDNGSIKVLLKRFAEQTTMHGLARVVSPEHHVIWKVVWLLLVLSAGGWATYNVYQIFQVYSKYPVIMSVDIEHNEKISFPAVTLCNLNIMRKSMYLNERLFQDIRTDLSKSGFTDNDEKMTFSDEALSQQKLKNFINLVPADYLVEIGHSVHDMVLMCDFLGMPCDYRNFSRFFNFKFGNCFTLTTDAEFKVMESGPNDALKLLLSVEEDEYMPQIPSAGVKIVVHPKTSMPFPDRHGILLSPGFLTHVGIAKSVYHRTGPPYGDCVNFQDQDNRAVNMYAAKLNVTYSEQACFSTCYQVEVANTCGCCDPDYPCTLSEVQGAKFDDSFNFTHSPNISYCNYHNELTAECVLFVKSIGSKEKRRQCETVCRPQCIQETFTPQVSVASWPTAPATEGIIALVKNNLEAVEKNTTVDKDFLKRNIIRVEVFFSQLSVEIKRTKPVYDWLQLLSDVGGQVGLWLGFSLMTAMELCQLFFNILHLLLAKLRRTTRGT